MESKARLQWHPLNEWIRTLASSWMVWVVLAGIKHFIQNDNSCTNNNFTREAWRLIHHLLNKLPMLCQLPLSSKPRDWPFMMWVNRKIIFYIYFVCKWVSIFIFYWVSEFFSMVIVFPILFISQGRSCSAFLMLPLSFVETIVRYIPIYVYIINTDNFSSSVNINHEICFVYFVHTIILNSFVVICLIIYKCKMYLMDWLLMMFE